MKLYIQNTNLREKIMKPVYKEFNCPQCGELRYIDVNGVCFDCNNKNTLLSLAEQRKLQQKLIMKIQPLSVESFHLN